MLIDSRDGAHRWSETYDRDAGDVFDVQDEIAGSIVRALQLAVVGDQEIPTRVRPRNPSSYELYLTETGLRRRMKSIGPWNLIHATRKCSHSEDCCRFPLAD